MENPFHAEQGMYVCMVPENPREGNPIYYKKY